MAFPALCLQLTRRRAEITSDALLLSFNASLMASILLIDKRSHLWTLCSIDKSLLLMNAKNEQFAPS